MLSLGDSDLLRRYTADKSEDAFAALVTRHINMVYWAALRQIREPQLAEEITQTVFVLLAKKARALRKETVLAGWLYRATRYVASEHLRSETRRKLREQAAMETLYQPSDSAHWEEIEPMLDAAMADLGEKDRNLVLLRYFENQSLKEVGAVFGISEDAAQKRIARAVEKLRTIFVQRGAGISTKALAGLLAVLAAQTVPASVTASVIAAVTAPTALAVTSVSSLTIFKIMALTKIQSAAIVAVVLAACTVPVLIQQRALNQVRAENETLRAELQQVSERPAAVAAHSTSNELNQLQPDAAEVLRLRGEVSALRRDNRERATGDAAAKTAGSEAADKTNPMERMNQGRDLMAQGKYPEALEQFLWCYDEGVKQSPSFVGVRSSFLLSELGALGKLYPPALEALAARRDAAEAAIAAGTSEMIAIHELIQLNNTVGKPAATVELFDRLPPNNSARAGLVDLGASEFLSAKRYQDIVDAGSPEKSFDRALSTKTLSDSHIQGNEMLQATMRRNVVESGGGGMEALAGAGQVERAKALADKVIQFDGSPETRGELLKHATRSGNSELIAYLKGP